MDIRSYLFRRRDLDDLRRRLKAMGQALGAWTDEMEQAIEVAILCGDDDYLGFISEQLEAAVAEAGVEVHPFLPNPDDPSEVGVGEIHLGRLGGGGEVRLPLADLLLNLFLTGPPRKGKSILITQIVEQLIGRGIPVHLYDTQDEYPDILAPLFGSDVLDVVDAADSKVNPFDGPEHMAQKEWVVGPMCNYLREALYWRDKTIELFRTVCLGLYDAGMAAITPDDFIAAYEKVPKSRQNLPEYGSLQRFATMLKTVETFRCAHGEKIETMAGKSRIYGLRYLPKDARLFLVSHLVTVHMLSREFRRDRSLELVFVFDELNQFITKETLARYIDIGESFFLELLRTSRRMGIGVVLADQVYSLIHDVARSNCQTKIVLEVRDAPSRREIARDLGLDRDQEAFLAQLSYGQERRRAAVQLSYYPRPILIEIPHFEKPKPLTPSQLDKRRQQAAQAMVWEPVPTPTREPRLAQETFLEEKELKLLKVIGCTCGHFPSQQEYAKKLGMAASTFSKWAAKLKRAGLLNEVSINLYSRGASIKFLYPTADGHAYLDRLKISYDPIPGDGSIIHRFWQRRIWTSVRRAGDLGGIEYELDGKRVDVAVVRPRQRIAYEVVMTGPLEKEVSNLRKDFVAGFDQVVFAVESDEVAERLTNLIAREVKENKDRVEVRLLKEFG